MVKRDFTRLTPDEKINGIKATKLPDYFRTKYHGGDVRESFAQLSEMVIQLGINMGLSPEESLKWARKLQEAVPRSEFDSWVATLVDGGPSIFMNTLSELKTTYPNGAAGVALVRETDPAKIYVWNGTAWEAFGDYQGIEVKDGTVDYLKLDTNLSQYFPTRFRFERGRPDSSVSLAAVTSTQFNLKKGDKITVPIGYNWALYYLDAGTFGTGWVTGDVIIREDTPNVKLVVRKDSNDNFSTAETKAFTKNVELISSNTLFSETVLADKVAKSLANNPRYLAVEEKGGIDAGTGTNKGDSLGTRRSLVHHPLKKGEKITLTDTINYSMALWTSEKPNGYLDNWNTTSYTAPRDVTISFMLAKGDSRIDAITSSEASSLVTIKNGDQLATYGDVVDMKGNTENNSMRTVYVALSGSDNNTGTSIADGYATLQKAIDSLGGNGTVIVERGVYKHQSVNYKIKDLTILPADDTYDSSKPNRQLVEFKGSDTLGGWGSYEGIYRTAYTGNNRFNQVFVSKSLPIETDNSRPSYNAVLWEGNNLIDDYKMEPVLTLAECKNKVGTFYYDGTYVYINPKEISNKFNAVKTDNGLFLNGDSLTMQDISFDFYTSNVMNVDRVKTLNACNCKANHSSSTDGWSLDYTNGVLTNCTGAKNRNDGFNMHFYGDTTLINCKGVNNYDDGVSHHEKCTGTVIGGRYSGNGKGGVIPVNDALVNVYNAVIEDNYYGFYSDRGDAISQGNFYKGNRYAIVNKDTDGMTSINDTFTDNTDTDLATNNVTPYGETIIS